MRSNQFWAGMSFGIMTLAASCTVGGQPDDAAPPPDASEITEILMADGTISGEQIKPYDFTWTQCTFQEGEWVNGPPLREALKVQADGYFELSQFSDSADGQQTIITHNLETETLRRTAMTQTVLSADGTEQNSLRLDFSPDGFTVQTSDGPRPGGAISSEMYGGAYLGLPLSTLDYSNGAFALNAGMLAVQGTYRVEAFPTESEKIALAGGTIETQRVDVWWLHHESGDVYEPGPNASGGRYWFLTSPDDTLPRVVAYKTDTYAIEIAPMTCNYE